MNKISKLFSLKNKTIIVAGGSGQIGFAMVEILFDAGANIAILDIDSEMGNEKVKALNLGSTENNIKVYKTDVSDKGSVTDSVQAVLKEFKSINGLVNCFHFKGNTRKLDTNANFFAGFEDYPVEAWDMVHDVNLKGSFLMTQACLPALKAAKSSSIVNISSTYGIVSANKSIYGESGINSPVAYATSKAAIINFSRYIATHFAEFGVRSNTLSPGGVFNNQSEEFLKNYTEKTPLNRMAEAEDYQGAIIYLMSDASSYMTGANLVVDGGWTAW